MDYENYLSYVNQLTYFNFSFEYFNIFNNKYNICSLSWDEVNNFGTVANRDLSR